MSDDMRVLYVGSGLSGRNTSLTGLVYGRVRTDVSLSVSSGDGVSSGYARVPGMAPPGVGVLAAVSSARSFFYYEDPSDPSLNPRVRCEIDALRDVDAFVMTLDCRPERREAASWALADLRRDLAFVGRDLARLPIVYQLTFLDWPGAVLPASPPEFVSAPPSAIFRSHPPSMTGTAEPLRSLVNSVLRLSQ